MKTFILALVTLVSFTGGFVLGATDRPNNDANTSGCTDPILTIAQQAVQEVVSAPYQQNPEDKKISYADEIKDERLVTIVFTLDDKNKIHVLRVSGGYNLVSQYIKNSLEGKEIHSDNAIPGINYVMTIKLPTSV